MKLDTPKISVVVPVYNVEEYLDHCLTSIVNQTMNSRDYEVIVVNDASTDDSGNIIERFVANNSNFISVHKDQNGGVSAARNTGIDMSRGEYICFVDSDDFIHPNFLQKMYSSCENTGSDIAYCGFYRYYPKHQKKIRIPGTPHDKIINSEKALRSLITGNFSYVFPWNKLFRRFIFVDNNLRFPENMCFEDLVTIPQAFYMARKVSVVHEPLYYYTKRKSSCIGSMTFAKTDDHIKACGKVRAFLENEQIYRKYKRQFKYVSNRSKFFNSYWIIKSHVKNKSLRGLLGHLRRSNKYFHYINSKKFDPNREIEF